MSNPYFRFKQFVVFHDRCAMKVGTDGTLLGTWVDVGKTHRILDVGTGSGLIALMLAQRTQQQDADIDPAIDAVEIDAAACVQAQENVQRSPWRDRIQIHQNSIQDYAADCPHRYDLIVANPPFFENVSKARGRARTLARHSDCLSQTDLLQVAIQLLQEDGRLAVIYPCEAAQKLQEYAQAFGLRCHRLLSVKPNLQRPAKRILMELSKQETQAGEGTMRQQIAIERAPKLYTGEFIALIKDFYLNY